MSVCRPECQRLQHEYIESPLKHVSMDRLSSAPGHAQEDNLVERARQELRLEGVGGWKLETGSYRVLEIKWSHPRAVSAIIVRVGCLSPVDGNALPPKTYRLAMSCAWQ